MQSEHEGGELVNAEGTVNTALSQITKAEIDQQIATAHAWPRSIARFKQRALDMVSLDEETAESCIYSRPVGKDRDGNQKFAEGMSIRMAEIVGACYGNLRVGAMLVEITPRTVRARGFAHDLETNFASTSEVVESTVDRYGKPYSERQAVVVAKAALSKARRDATFSVVPRALCRAIELEARRVAIGDATTLEKRRGVVMQWIGKLGIDPARVFAALSVNGEADLGLEHLTTLTGLKTAIKDGEVTVDESFPPLVAPAEALPDGATAGDRLKAAARRGAAKPPPPATGKGEEQAAAETAEARTSKGPTFAELAGQMNRAKTQDIRDQVLDAGRELSDEQRADLVALHAHLSGPAPTSDKAAPPPAEEEEF